LLRETFLHHSWELSSPNWLTPPGRLGYSRLGWLPASVPGHVHLDLLRASVISDPFAGLAEIGCQWVDREAWSYRTRFEWTPDDARPHRILRFEGLDTVASVWLDGEKLAEHDDMFVPLEIELSARLTPGRHELRVEFASAVEVGNERRKRYLASEGIAENVVRFDERAFVQKAQYMYGWDWGPRLVSAGIWRPVSLIEHAGRIRDVHVEQRHGADGSVELEVGSEHDGPGRMLHFLDGSDEPLLDGEPRKLTSPELWWPAGLGAQHLSVLTSYLVPEDVNTRAAAEKRAVDRRVTRVGLRRIELLRERDRFGESFELAVNGKRIYCNGANWIPDHSFPSVISRARVLDQLARARDMNMNMLRVWGGGLYESSDFYGACDELGLLVWQDFPYACQYYPEDAASLEAARRQARENVRRLRNHPSLALWCGNNENLTMFESGWEDKDRHPPRYYGQKIYDEVLPAVLAELDPSRPYVPSSPWGGEVANGGGIGDQHYWDVWHGRGDWKHYDDSTARFASEFGFASAPGTRAWKKILPGLEDPLAASVYDSAARWHDKTLKGHDTFLGMVELHYPHAKNLEEWTFFSQLNQRDALRHGIEHFRRSEFCKGALVWQHNDCWPVQSWSVIDSEGDYKAAGYELRRLFAPALASLVISGTRAALWLVLDNAHASLTEQAVVEVRSLLDGEILASAEAELTLAPGERRVALELDLARFEPRETFVVAYFADSFTFRLLSEPKDARLSTPRLTASSTGNGLIVTSDLPVVDLFFWDAHGKARFYDNFVTLPGGGELELRTSAEPGALRARSLAGPHTVELPQKSFGWREPSGA
jgi:beta-mannosidase